MEELKKRSNQKIIFTMFKKKNTAKKKCNRNFNSTSILDHLNALSHVESSELFITLRNDDIIMCFHGIRGRN